jgi:uncharacterized protein (TIGR01244 family)
MKSSRMDGPFLATAAPRCARRPTRRGLRPRTLRPLTRPDADIVGAARSSRRRFVGAVAVSAFAQQPAGIRNFLKINTEFCTGGQPTTAQLSELKAQGITTVINLRTVGEAGFDAAAEEAETKKLGMKYFNIPVSNQTGPKDEQADEFLKLTDDAKNRPVFIHCGSANRVGGFFLIRRVLRDGMTFDAAKAEATKIGLQSASLEEFAKQYIAKHKK